MAVVTVRTNDPIGDHRGSRNLSSSPKVNGSRVNRTFPNRITSNKSNGHTIVRNNYIDNNTTYGCDKAGVRCTRSLLRGVFLLLLALLLLARGQLPL